VTAPLAPLILGIKTFTISLMSGGGGISTHATKERIANFLEECEISDAKIVSGNQGKTDWVISTGFQSEAKWDCLKQQKSAAGVIATSWRTTKEYETD